MLARLGVKPTKCFSLCKQYIHAGGDLKEPEGQKNPIAAEREAVDCTGISTTAMGDITTIDEALEKSSNPGHLRILV